MMFINTIKKYMKMKKNKYIWKSSNKHNQTWIGEVGNIDIVSVGNESWGAINIIDFIPNDKEKCKIYVGNFVSIAQNVFFMRGGEHRLDRISTFLYKSRYNLGNEDNLKSSKDIIVEDDVWIGYNVLILPGSKIGQGAVIGAGSTVRGEVPAYSIYVGDKVIKYRFSEKIVSEIKKIDYSRIDSDFVKKNINFFYKPVTQDLINKLCHQEEIIDNEK